MPEPMRLEEISDALRREIWNKTRRQFEQFYNNDTSFIMGSLQRILGRQLEVTEDEIPEDYISVFRLLKTTILESHFNKVLDLIELILNEIRSISEIEYNFVRDVDVVVFIVEISHIFEIYAAAYWLDLSRRPYQFFPRSNKAQGDATQKAIETIRDSGMKGAETHLRQAVTHINTGQFADSIADSIHAVESVARTIDPKAKTLGEALSSLEKSGLLKHHALKEAFSKLYGYTSDEQGIRHSLLDKPSPDVDLDEAMFMFGACASFAAYLVNKHRKAAQRQGSGQ